jgi:PAS domain S-box-containing protein
MSNEIVRILMIEDMPEYAELIKDFILAATEYHFEITHFLTLQEGLAYLNMIKVDVVLLDLNLSDSQGLDTLEKVRAASQDIAIIVMTGVDDSHTAITAMQSGAQDYLVKGNIDHQSLIRAVCYSIERIKIEIALRDSEAFVCTLIDAIPIPLFYKDMEGRYLGFNKAFENLFGETQEQLVGKSVFDINPPYLAQKYHEKDKALFESGGEQQYEAQIKSVDGKVRDVIFNKAIFNDRDGEPGGLIGTILDITDRKKTEKRLLESETRYRTLIESSADGIIVADKATMKIRFANIAIGKMLGYFPKELIDMEVTNIHPKDSLEMIFKEYEKYKLGKKLIIENIPCLRKDETVIFTDITITIMELDGMECSVGFFRDITDRKKAEEYRRTTQELQVFNEAMLDREERIIELKEEVNRLALELGKPIPYETVWEDENTELQEYKE